MNVLWRLLIIGMTGLVIALRGGAAEAGQSQYTTLDDPSASISDGTFAIGVNRPGDIVGVYVGLDGIHHGFLLHQSHFTTLTYSSVAARRGPGTVATGINARGDIVGYYLDSAFLLHGFLRRQGIYIPLDDPAAGPFGSTEPWGINDQGDIVGVFTGTKHHMHGFLLRHGRYSTLNDPKADPRAGSVAEGINTQGDIVGYYLDRARTAHGFLLHQGRYVTLDDPLAQSGDLLGTYAYGINDQGDVVGYYSAGTAGAHSKAGDHGFLLHQERYATVDNPGAGANGYRRTCAYGINNRGDIVGSYTDANYLSHGFLRRLGTGAAAFRVVSEPRRSAPSSSVR